jgi:hypothetical protein
MKVPRDWGLENPQTTILTGWLAAPDKPIFSYRCLDLRTRSRRQGRMAPKLAS